MPDDPVQSKRFIDMAREREADETEDGAERAFKKVVSKSSNERKDRSQTRVLH
jgi:hypothetical protein